MQKYWRMQFHSRFLLTSQPFFLGCCTPKLKLLYLSLLRSKLIDSSCYFLLRGWARTWDSSLGQNNFLNWRKCLSKQMENPYFRPHLTYFRKLSISLSFLDQMKWFFLQKNHIWWGYHVEKEFQPFNWKNNR